MRKNQRIMIILAGLLINAAAFSQGNTSLAEHLGYPSDAKLLIVHADDLGLSHSANKASIKAFENNGISSGSIMVPCPWFAEFAAYAKDHPGLDVGIHLTLTAEWEHYKWDGVSPSSEIRSLLDDEGYFYASTEQVGQHADPVEAEKEFRAQIERALAFGITPSHFDTHMASAGATPELFQIYLKLGREYNTPVLLPRIYLLAMPPEVRDEIVSDYVLLDNIYMMGEDAQGTWNDSYKQMIESMKPGLNQLIVHLGFDDEEMKAISIDHDAFGAAWREKDLEYVLSDEFKEQLKENDIKMVGWKEIQDYMRTLPEAGDQKAEEMEANFVHVVYFWLKNPDDKSDRDKFEASLNKFIDNSKFIMSKHIGTPADTDRPVIDNTWTYSLVLGFKNKEEQDKYQDEEVHKKFIEESEELWEKVLVYDSVSMKAPR